MKMTTPKLNALVKDDQKLVHAVTCPLDQHVGKIEAETRERHVVYSLLRHDLSCSDIELVLESFAAGEPYRNAVDKHSHLNAILKRATEKGIPGKELIKVILDPRGNVRRPKLKLFFG